MKALVVLSGGTDSAVALSMAVHETGREGVDALFFNYGQKSEGYEWRAARELVDYYKLPNLMREITIPDVFAVNPLTGVQPIPEGALRELKPIGPSPVEVPFRNGVMLSLAAALAVRLESRELWHGIHAEDGTEGAYPDNSRMFLEAMSAVIYTGSGSRVRLISPFVVLTKTEVIDLGHRYEVPFHLTYTCYKGTMPPCGTCISCTARKEAFERNGLADPVAYAV